ncbi:MAG: hypothetical protein ACRDJU_05815, partial [Actinomycetota bacterium]
MGVLDEIAAATASVAGSAGPSVVGIGGGVSEQAPEGRGRRGRGGAGWGVGSGVVIAAGKVLTNA